MKESVVIEKQELDEEVKKFRSDNKKLHVVSLYPHTLCIPLYLDAVRAVVEVV